MKERRGVATALQTKEECRGRRDEREAKGETRRRNGVTNEGGVSMKERRARNEGKDAVTQRRYKQRRSVDEGETAREKNGQQKKRRGVARASQTEEECR